MSLGSVKPLSDSYLDRLAALVERYQPAWISEHLCWSANSQHNSHDLLPMPYTEAAVQHMSERISQVQEHLDDGFWWRICPAMSPLPSPR